MCKESEPVHSLERMAADEPLVRTLDFQLDIQPDNESLLYDATLVKNTTQHAVAKALDGMEDEYEYGALRDHKNLRFSDDDGRHRGAWTPRP